MSETYAKRHSFLVRSGVLTIRALSLISPSLLLNTYTELETSAVKDIQKQKSHVSAYKGI